MKGADSVGEFLETSNDTAEIRALTRFDYGELSSFLSRVGGKSVGYWANRFELWWESNPNYSSKMARGWVIVDVNRIVGFIGAIPSLMAVKGREEVAIGITSWNVEEAYRSFSMELFFTLSRYARDAIVFDTTPSKDVTLILKAFKFQTFPFQKLGQSIVPINGTRMLEYQIRSVVAATAPVIQKTLLVKVKPLIRNFNYSPVNKVGKRLLEYFVHVVARTCSPLFWGYSKFRINIGAGVDELKTSQVFKVYADVETLWNRTCDQYLITNVRTTKNLQWYCFQSKDHLKDLFTCYKQGVCVGYIVGRVIKNQDLLIFDCMDVWLDPACSSALDALLVEVINFGRKKGIDAIQIPHFSLSLRELCTNMGLFSRVPAQDGWYLKMPKRLSHEMSLSDSYLCRIQGDNGL